jgi:transposase
MAVRLALLGQTAAQVVPRVLFSVRQVYAWVARYNADGPGRGRKGPLTPDEQQRLAARLRAGPTEADGVCTLRGEDSSLCQMLWTGSDSGGVLDLDPIGELCP